jgi:Divergent InlB B-repeat domain
MKEVYTKKRSRLGVISGAVVAIVVGILGCCNPPTPPAPVKYVLTVQNNSYCTTVPSGQVTVESGAATTITAAADLGLTFGGWTIKSGAASIANPNQATTTVTLTSGDATILAGGKYVLTVQNNGNCTTIPSGTVLVDPGASTSIQAWADAGHTWDATSGWTVVSGTVVIANDAQSGTTVTLSAGDATIEAHCP